MIVPDWYQRAYSLAEYWKSEPLHPAADHVLGHFAVSHGVACSGGADSLALLLILWARYPHRRGQMRVLHFNHGVRGEAADADAAFVREVAHGLELPYHEGAADFPSGAQPGEDALRNARLKFFAETGCAVICLGQHANDVAETQLMRLSRGAGVDGLSAPRPVSQPAPNSPVHIRPLLDWPREMIEEGLRANDIAWREDASNATGDYFRNRVRHNVWPTLVEASPGNALAGVVRSRRLFEEDADALDNWLESVFPARSQTDALPSNRLQGKPRALWRRALTRWLARHRLLDNLSANGLDDLLDNWIEQAPMRFSIGPGKFLVADTHGVIKILTDSRAPSWAPCVLTPGCALAQPGGRWIALQTITLDDDLRGKIRAGKFSEKECVYLDWNGQPPRVQVRLWQPGDRYRPLGSPGSRKLQDCFTDRKIEERERKRLPVVCDERGDILWAPGLPPAESRRIGPQGKTALWLTYRAF